MSWDFNSIPKYLINLDRRRDRLQQFQSQPGVADFSNLRRWPAVDGSKLNIIDDKRVSVFTKSNILKGKRRSHSELSTKGGVGCYFSHVAVWQDFMNSSSEVALVLEDDVQIDINAGERIAQFIANSAVIKNTELWDFCILSPHGWSKKGGPILMDDPLCVELKEFTSLAGYLINKNGVRKIMPHVFPVEGHVDWFLTISKQVGIINLCTPYRRLLGYNLSKTDIQVTNDCDVCDVKTDYKKTSVLVPRWRLSTYRLEELVLTIGLIGVLFSFTQKR